MGINSGGASKETLCKSWPEHLMEEEHLNDPCSVWLGENNNSFKIQDLVRKRGDSGILYISFTLNKFQYRVPHD